MKSSLFLIAIAVGCMNCSKGEGEPEAAKTAERTTEAAGSQKAAAPKDGIAVHCDQIEELGYCTETPYAAPTWEALGADLLEERCATGTFGKADCPEEGRVGSCDTGELIWFYDTGKKPRTAEEASAFCGDMFSGTFKKR